MKRLPKGGSAFFLSIFLSSFALTAYPQTVPEQSFAAANHLSIKVKQVAPGNQEGPLQILCYFKHKQEGDKVLAALVEFDQRIGGIIKGLRNRGEFAGDERETIYFVPPSGSLKTEGVLLIGLGDEKHLSLNTMSRVGTTALREAVRLKAARVSYASTIKDQGVDKLEAGEVAASVIKSVILAYDTEHRLQQQGHSSSFHLEEWIYEAGPAFYASTVSHVRNAIAEANQEITVRDQSGNSR